MSKTTNKNAKFGLFCYDTINIGDEIQSLAARRFLPKVDYYFNRNNIDQTITPANEKIRLIMNGWFIEPALDNGRINWPPKNPNIEPLIISMHTSFLNGSTDIFKSSESIHFLKTHAPVGARDKATYDYFKSLDIPTYFSGCLTLTLLPDKNIKKQKFILAVDVSEEIYQNILLRTKRPIIRMNTSHINNLSVEARFILAQYWLTLYQSAHCVITTRLHAMLPCLPFNTPVIGISARDSERFAGLIELTNHYSETDFIKDKSINLDKPPKNPTAFRKIRDNLVRACSNFTGYDSKSSYLYGSSPLELYTNPKLIDTFVNSIQNTYASKYIIKDLENTIQTLNKNLAISHSETTPGIKESAKNLLHAIKKRLVNN